MWMAISRSLPHRDNSSDREAACPKVFQAWRTSRLISIGLPPIP